MSSAHSQDRERGRRTTITVSPVRKHYDDDEEDEEEDEDEEDDDSKPTKASKAKKLASGKRADQNRKAQRAFRQRKDKYIKDLELRSQELDIANSLIIQLKEENDRLNEIAKSFHNRVGELEAQLSRISNSQSTNQLRRGSDHYTPASPRGDEQYYTQRAGPTRNQAQQYEPGHHAGSIYSQSQGLI